MTATKNTSKPTPPPAALAADAHWASTVERLRARKLPTTTLTICDDPDLRHTLAKARAARDSAQAAVDALDGQDEGATALARDRLEKAETGLAQAKETFDEAAIVLTFRALPRKALEKLIGEHPPTEDEEKDGEDWHADTFNPALIEASSVDGITAADARAFLDEWSSADARALFQAALGAQQTSRTDLGKG